MLCQHSTGTIGCGEPRWHGSPLARPSTERGHVESQSGLAGLSMVHGVVCVRSVPWPPPLPCLPTYDMDTDVDGDLDPEAAVWGGWEAVVGGRIEEEGLGFGVSLYWRIALGFSDHTVPPNVSDPQVQPGPCVCAVPTRYVLCRAMRASPGKSPSRLPGLI